MFNGKRIVAITPARGGSKGLPGKNVKLLAGKPLIAWSIEAARNSRYVDEVIVSTDDAQIAKAAEAAGARCPFTRPAELAGDQAQVMDSIIHAINWLREHDEHFDLVLLLQPTSPLRSSAEIDAAIELFFAKSATTIISVCENEHHPWWSNSLPDDGNMEHFLRPETLSSSNRQELPPSYRVNGAIYLAEIATLLKTKSLYGPATYAYLMPQESSVDIDSALDFHLAEAILAARQAS